MSLDIISESNNIFIKLQKNKPLASFIEDLAIPEPYMVNGPVKLIILGQDPTVKIKKSRKNIKKVLNLDNKNGALNRYLKNLCDILKININENVYATNVIKNFFTDPPTVILKYSGIDVLKESALFWLPLLQKELNQFPDVPIISLGEPILKVLVQNGSQKMKDYWGYSKHWQTGHLNSFSKIEAENCVINRQIYPVIHQPCKNQIPFYKHVFDQYIHFIKTEISQPGIQ